MCSVSAIGDNYRDTFPQRWPQYPTPNEWYQYPNLPGVVSSPVTGPSKYEFEALKKEVEALKELLQAAKKYDAKTGQPHCEMDDKVGFIKKIAEMVGVDLADVFDKPE